MAIYVTSDLHGNHEKYIQIFDKINFTDDDTLFVLGDIVDRGTGSMKILLDMMSRFNVIPILGNHELMFIKAYKEKIENSLNLWFENDGQNTFNEFLLLKSNEQEAVLNYLQRFSLYKELNINNQDYILVHSGFDKFKKRKPLKEYTVEELVWAETDYDKVYFKDKILITGHTPVSAILFDSTADKI